MASSPVLDGLLAFVTSSSGPCRGNKNKQEHTRHTYIHAHTHIHTVHTCDIYSTVRTYHTPLIALTVHSTHAALWLDVVMAGPAVSGSKRYPRLDEGHGLGAVSTGSYGRVYAAVDKLTMQTVAVKRQILPSDDAARELAFYKALSHAPHPNVMCLLDHFMTDVKKGCVSTWCLSSWTQRCGPCGSSGAESCR